MSDDFHEIREKTGIDKIKGSERKDLFNKFRDGGGELLDADQNKKKNFIIDRDAQKQHLTKIETRKSASGSRGSIVKKRPVHSRKGNKLTLSIRFNNFLMGVKNYFSGIVNNVFNFDGITISASFAEHWETKTRESVYELQLFIFEILHRDDDSSDVLRGALNKNNKFYISILEKLGTIYDDDIFVPVTEEFNRLPEKRVVRLLAPKLLPLFKKLYILHRFQRTCNLAIDAAIDLAIIKNPDNKSIYKKRNRNLIKASEYLLIDFFEKLFILLRRYWKSYPDLHSPDFDKFLDSYPSNF